MTRDLSQEIAICGSVLHAGAVAEGYEWHADVLWRRFGRVDGVILECGVGEHLCRVGTASRGDLAGDGGRFGAGGSCTC